ncbi:MAG: hypothetical protein M1467_05880 [Deltaproteobacteria bacterium]|nr:hypothetical protein [Deltaproteobacteria bacterium]
MGKKNKKKILLYLLNSNATKLSYIVEQNIEEILNEVITNNYKIHDSGINDFFFNKSKNEFDIICKEISSLSLKILEKDEIIFFKPVFKKKKIKQLNIIYKTLRIIKFTENMKNIYNNLELIKLNINELYKYPVLKVQTYIPELCLYLSAFFKENIDIFFMDINHEDIKERKKIVMEKLYKIMSLGNKIINEFYINIISDEKSDIQNGGHVIYHSNIISIIQIISINCVEFNLL